MDENEINNLLYRIYYTENNYDSVEELYRKSKPFNKMLKKEDVRIWLKNQSTHQQTTIKKIKKRENLPIYSDSNYAYQIDLTFLPKYKYENNNYYVIFTAININSRYAYAYYSKDKTEESILKMLNEWLKNVDIETITMDNGSEFTDKKIIKWFENNNITTFYTSNSHKLGIVNRFHRTLKEKLLKYFIANDNVKWVDVIDKIIKNYNNTRHTGIYNFTPTEASKPLVQSYIINKKIEKTDEINNLLDEDEIFNIGDIVRVKLKANIFDKMKAKYTENLYRIKIIYKNSVDLEDLEGNIYKNIRKSDIIKIKDNQNYKPSANKIIVEQEYKTNRKLKSDGLNKANIIEGKRNRNNVKYTA